MNILSVYIFFFCNVDQHEINKAGVLQNRIYRRRKNTKLGYNIDYNICYMSIYMLDWVI